MFDPATTRPVLCGTTDTFTGLCRLPPAAPDTPPGQHPQIGFVREPFAGNMISAIAWMPMRSSFSICFLPQLTPIFSIIIRQIQFRGMTPTNLTCAWTTLSVRRTTFSADSVILTTLPLFLGPLEALRMAGSFSAGNQTSKSLNAVVSETHLFSTSLVNEVRAGYSRLTATRLQPNADTPGYSRAVWDCRSSQQSFERRFRITSSSRG